MSAPFRSRPAVRAAVFLLLLALMLSLLSALFLPKNNTEEAGMHFVTCHGYLAEPKDSIDAFFIGDSLAYAAYTPLEIWEAQGISSYVSAIGGETMDEGYNLLRELLHYQHPKVIVLEAHMIARIAYPNLAVYYEASYFFSVFTDHDRWKSLSPETLLMPVQYTSLQPDKGYRPDSDVVPADAAGYMAPCEEPYHVALSNQINLARFIRLCRRSGVEVLICATPSPLNWTMAKHDAVARLAAQYDVPFLDLSFENDALGIDWSTDSRDGGDHLNNNGASKVSRYMGAYLAEHYSLPDHRGDSAYAAWDTALADYKLRMAQ